SRASFSNRLCFCSLRMFSYASNPFSTKSAPLTIRRQYWAASFLAVALIAIAGPFLPLNRLANAPQPMYLLFNRPCAICLNICPTVGFPLLLLFFVLPVLCCPGDKPNQLVKCFS